MPQQASAWQQAAATLVATPVEAKAPELDASRSPAISSLVFIFVSID
jgi:hypothetical protein